MILFIQVLILPSHQRLGLSSDSFLPVSPRRTLCAFVFCPLHATCPSPPGVALTIHWATSQFSRNLWDVGLPEGEMRFVWPWGTALWAGTMSLDTTCQSYCTVPYNFSLFRKWCAFCWRTFTSPCAQTDSNTHSAIGSCRWPLDILVKGFAASS